MRQQKQNRMINECQKYVEEGDIGVEEEITNDMVNAEIQYDEDDDLGIVAGPVAAV